MLWIRYQNDHSPSATQMPMKNLARAMSTSIKEAILNYVDVATLVALLSQGGKDHL